MFAYAPDIQGLHAGACVCIVNPECVGLLKVKCHKDALALSQIFDVAACSKDVLQKLPVKF